MTNRRPVILVVEDHAFIRMSAVDFLSAAGFETLEAESADHAILILETRQDIHLVFTDVEMPGTMDGLKLAHYIRNRWPPVKLIVASGKMLVDESHLPHGAHFFPKPYSDSVIVEAMQGLLADGR